MTIKNSHFFGGICLDVRDVISLNREKKEFRLRQRGTHQFL